MGAVDFDASAWVERERNRLAANPAKAAKVEPVDSDQTLATLATLATEAHSPAVAIWRDGLASLDPDKPRNGVAADSWRRMLLDGDAFLTDWGEQAAALGWTADNLFACPPKPGRRLDLDGLVTGLEGRSVVLMTDSHAMIDAGDGKLWRHERRDRRSAVLWWWP